MVHAYIDEILVMTKDVLKYHLKSLKKVLQRLAEAGLKVNAEN